MNVIPVSDIVAKQIIQNIPDEKMCVELQSVYCDGKECPGLFKIKEKIGSGAFGEVFQTCQKDDCSFICKYQKDISSFLNEMKYHYIASVSGLAPNLFEAWRCSYGGFMIMKKLETTVLVKMFDPKLSLKEKSRMIEECFESLERLHQLSIVHGDSHLSNFMVDKYNKVYLIDYGLSKDFSERGAEFDFDTLQMSIQRIVEMKPELEALTRF